MLTCGCSWLRSARLLVANVALVVGLLVASGCGVAPPGEKEARQYLERTLKKVDGTVLERLNSVTKTSGQRSEALGAKLYEMWYEAETETTRDYWDGVVGGGFSSAISLEPKVTNAFGRWTKVPKGTKSKKSGKLTFRQTEKGWAAWQ